MRTFAILTLTQALSLIGSRMTSIAVGIWVYTETGDVTPILLTSFFLEVPGMVITSLAGVLADRWDRRYVIMLGDAGEAVGTSILLISFLSGHFQLWHLYAAALFKGMFMTLQEPAADAALTMLIPADGRERFNGLKEMVFPLAGVLSPVLAGSLYPLIDVTGIVIIDLITFGIAVMVVALLRIPLPAPSEEGLAASGTVWDELRGGLRFLCKRQALLALLIYMTLTNFLLNGPLELSLPYLTTVTGSERWTGALLGVMSAGALAGAALIAAWGGTRPRIHTLLPGMALTGGMMILYGMARSPLTLGITLFLAMLPLPVTNAVFKSIMQVKTPPDMQGRVFAIFGQLAYTAAPLSFLVTGPIVDRLLAPRVGGEDAGAMGALLMIAGGLLAVVSLGVYALPVIWRVEANLPDYHVAEASQSAR